MDFRRNSNEIFWTSLAEQFLNSIKSAKLKNELSSSSSSPK